MQTNLYYRTVIQRRNVFKETLYSLFLAYSSWPRMLLEVFTRRNMGERYFSFSGAITLLIILAVLPVFTALGVRQLHGDFSLWLFIRVYLSWYLFLGGFLYMVIQRDNEIKRLPSVFDFKRYSKSAGYIEPRFLQFITRGRDVDIRLVETALEPRVFFFIGLGLAILGQPIGSLLVHCSIFYSLSYRAAYREGDHLVMDKIDEMICTEEFTKSMVEGRDASETRGFNFRGRRPADPDARRRVADMFITDDETVEAF